MLYKLKECGVGLGQEPFDLRKVGFVLGGERGEHIRKELHSKIARHAKIAGAVAWPEIPDILVSAYHIREGVIVEAELH